MAVQRQKCLILLLAGLIAAPADAQDIERPPIRYSSTTPDNAISRFQEKLDRGEAKLTHEEGVGYLRSLLHELQVPIASQMLVFSKTSLQRDRISPRRPRAIYFNDEVYVGFCQKGEVIELSVADPRVGTAFYTLPQKPQEKPAFRRHDESCLVCHGSTATQGAPGHLVRSVYSDSIGFPILSLGSHRTNQSSPMIERWGGWYVTGTSGSQKHLGNLIVEEGQDRAEIDNSAGVNVTDLSSRLDLESYLSPHSDIVALMVLEHQTEMHNRLVRANFLVRQALHEEEEINTALGKEGDGRSESIERRIHHAGDDVLEYLLFCDETALTAPIAGTSDFTQEFSKTAPRDPQGRSLRDLDLSKKLFKYPCSYLIYTEAFDALPEQVHTYVLERLWKILAGQEITEEFAHLTEEDRRAIREIILATKTKLSPSWQASQASR